MKDIKRRDFVKASALMLAGTSMGAHFATAAGQREEGTYRIYFITDTHLENESSAVHTVRLNSLKHFVSAVNKDRNCDLAFHLGDLCQTGNYEGIVDGARLWGGIRGLNYVDATDDADYPWYAIGNHEVNTKDPDEFAHKFSQTKTSEGGSVWNGQFTYDRYDYKLHFVMMDCLYDANNERSERTDGLHEETVSWLQNILQTTDANMVVLMSHAMPHFHSAHSSYYWGRSAQGDEIVNIVEDAIGSNENLEKVAWFAGHWHGVPWDGVREYTNLGEHLVGYRIPPAQDATSRRGAEGVYSVVEINPEGEISTESFVTPAEYQRAGASSIIVR